VVGTIVGAILYFFVPRVYRASAVIQIVPPRITTDLVKRQPRPSLRVRIDSLTSRVLTRTKLETLITEFNLYEEMRRHEVMEDVIAQMNRDVEVSPTSEDTFQVAYHAPDRLIAMRVTTKLAQLFINEQYMDRQFVTVGTVQFLDSQVEELRSRLADWEEMSQKLHSPPPRYLVIDNEVVEERYRTLNRELLAAQTAAAIERSELGEQFRLLEAARAPETPISVPVFRFLAWGAFVGAAGRLMAHILWVQRRSRVLRLTLYALIALVLLGVALLGYLYWW